MANTSHDSDVKIGNDTTEMKFLERIGEIVASKEDQEEKERMRMRERISEVSRRKEEFTHDLNELKQGLKDLVHSDKHTQDLKLYLKMTGEQGIRISEYFNFRHENQEELLGFTSVDTLYITGQTIYRSSIELRANGIYYVEESCLRSIDDFFKENNGVILNTKENIKNLIERPNTDEWSWNIEKELRLDTILTLQPLAKSRALREAVSGGITLNSIYRKTEELYQQIAS